MKIKPQDYYEVTSIRQIAWMIEESRAEVHFADGTVAGFPAAGPSTEITSVRRISFCFNDNKMTLTLARGEIVTAEVDMLGTAGPQPNGRLFAYLDQCHWRPIADRLHSGMRVQHASHVDRIIELARTNQVIFPLSSAHMVETAPTYGARRQDIAATMLEFSRGWQMRNPLAVRQDEITKHFMLKYTGQQMAQPPVFTVDPDVMYFDDHSHTQDLEGITGALPPRIAYLTDCMVKTCATYDTLMEPEPVTTETAGWTKYFQRIAKDFNDNRYSRPAPAR